MLPGLLFSRLAPLLLQPALARIGYDALRWLKRFALAKVRPPAG
jgi:hypothetical protein